MSLQTFYIPYDHFLYKKKKDLKVLLCDQATGSSSVFYVHIKVEFKINKHNGYGSRGHVWLEIVCINFMSSKGWETLLSQGEESCVAKIIEKLPAADLKRKKPCLDTHPQRLWFTSILRQYWSAVPNTSHYILSVEVWAPHWRLRSHSLTGSEPRKRELVSATCAFSLILQSSPVAKN